MFLIFTFLPVIEVNATEDVDYDIETDSYGNDEYDIKQYKVNMVINEDNTYDITEYIEVYFNVEKRGIIRNIPKANKIERLDGSKSSNRAKISNVSVNDNYTIFNGRKYDKIKIGDPNKTLTGYESYEISYTYDIGNDKSKGFDELYFNIIGTEWDTTISNIEFTITMPKEFDESKIGFSHGVLGSTDSSSIVYSIDDKTISGEFTGVLEAYEGLTIRLELPEGYFLKRMDPIKIFALTIPIFCLLISFVVWLIYGKNDRIIKTVEFYPPEDYNSAEVGFLYKGKVKNKDIVSLLIYLANKGYIKIIESDTHSDSKKTKSFTFEKIKRYDGDNYYERLFFRGLFKGSKDKVEISYLENKFYTTADQIKKKFEKQGNINKIFCKKSFKMRTLVGLFAIISYISIVCGPFIAYGVFKTSLINILFLVVGLILIVYFLLIKKGLTYRIYGLTSGMFVTILFFDTSFYTLDMDNLTAFIVGITCFVAILMLIKFMPKRTSFGLEILGRIKGFKRFLKVAEKQKLQALVMENPTYFYDIMPYAYVLGIFNKWIKKFETITLEEPNWYSGRNDFSINTFNNSINITMKQATSAMTSLPYDMYKTSDGGSSGGGFSGGGSSGGGSGGGGGSSWWYI